MPPFSFRESAEEGGSGAYCHSSIFHFFFFLIRFFLRLYQSRLIKSPGQSDSLLFSERESERERER